MSARDLPCKADCKSNPGISGDFFIFGLTFMKITFLRGKLNFRKPVNIFFLCLIGGTVLVIAIASCLQWQEQVNVYDRLSLDAVNNARVDFELAFDEVGTQLNELGHALENAKNIDNIYSHIPQLRRSLMIALALISIADSLYIADTKDRLFLTPYFQHEKIPSFKPSERPWFIQHASNSRQTKFSSGYYDLFTNKEVFSLSRRILNRGGDYNVAGVDINAERVTNTLKKMKLTLSAQVFLINEEGQRILGNEKKWQPLTKAQLSRLYGTEGIIRDPENGRRIYYSRMLYPEWTVLMVADHSIMNQILLEESIMPAVTLLTAIGLLLVAWWRSLQNLHLFYLKLASTLNSDTAHPMDVDKLLETELVKNQVTLRDIEQQSRTDSLTGLLNRQAFNDDIDRLIGQNTDRLTLALIDLDNFKTINDTFGHQTGDEVLKAFASAARAGLDEAVARLYRYGGEEFAVIYTHISPEQAKDMLDAVRLAFSTRKWREGMKHVSFSAGMKTRIDESVQELIAGADTYLYRAKRCGKNKIVDNPQTGDVR
ncbi:diguanylate cyclase [Enterobacter sp. ECC-175]|uniref:sensor domain-containing diguanylate cyclase n=1 Tax=Enterobacter sp. ECC-175 TaxID=3116479 RepID=UPI003754074D